jgi:hypothetical protein
MRESILLGTVVIVFFLCVSRTAEEKSGFNTTIGMLNSF